MGKTFQTGKLVNGFSVDDSGNVTIAATTYLGSSASSRIEAASNIIRGFFSTESTPRFSIGRDVFANGQAGISLGSGTAYAGIGVNTTGDGAGNVLYFSLNATSSTALNSNVYATLTTSGLSVTGTGSFTSSSGGVLSVTSNTATSSGFLNHSSFMAPNMTGGGLSIGFGKSNGTYNLAKIVYNHAGNASSSNYIGLGFWDADNIFNVTAGGKVGIGTSSPTHNLEIANAGGSVYQKLNADFGIGYFGMETADDSMRFVTAQATPIQIYTNNTERMRITSDGRVGIGITPASGMKLDVYGPMAINDQEFRWRTGSDANHGTKYDGTTNGPFMYGYFGGAIGYNQGTGSNTRVIWSNTTSAYNYNNSTTWQQTSDIRIKENIRPIGNALDKICSLNPSHFEYKTKLGITKTGFIAQEFEQVFPGHVSEIDPIGEYQEYFEEGEMMKTIDADLIPYLVKAIQELKAEIEILKNK